jgi:hypothetical protein
LTKVWFFLKLSRKASRSAKVLSWVGPGSPGAPVEAGIEYSLSSTSSETVLAKVPKDDIVEEGAKKQGYYEPTWGLSARLL